MSTEEVAHYKLGEALALLAPIVGCPVEDARDYVLVVITKDGHGAVGASERLPPALAARVLRASADQLEAGQ
jgi:hypothetical protein